MLIFLEAIRTWDEKFFGPMAPLDQHVQGLCRSTDLKEWSQEKSEVKSLRGQEKVLGKNGLLRSKKAVPRPIFFTVLVSVVLECMLSKKIPC